MSHTQLPIESLPAWMRLNGVSPIDIRIANAPGQGYGVFAERNFNITGETLDIPALLTIPRGLLLNREAVHEYAKEDRNFRQLLDAAGHQSARLDILLFLIVQLARDSGTAGGSAGIPNPWTEYIKFLPTQVPLPTLWTDQERVLLRGTSLEAANTAKRVSLEREFDRFKQQSSDILCWDSVFWDNDTVALEHWFLLDAWFRSRSLEIPNSDEALIPCLDMVNHSSTPNAYYEEISQTDIALLLRTQSKVSNGDEIVITYGDEKTAAEMLFSYGFIDPQTTHDGLVLPLQPFPDDPLAKAKLYLFDKPATVVLTRVDGTIHWEAPFVYLMCANEEDGLDFRLQQERGGDQQLRMFWQDVDVTDSAGSFAALTDAHERRAIFDLRVVTVIQELLQGQIERMQSVTPASVSAGQAHGRIREDIGGQAKLLRDIETKMLEEVVEDLEQQKAQLLADDKVVAYLGSMENAQSDLAGGASSNEVGDYS